MTEEVWLTSASVSRTADMTIHITSHHVTSRLTSRLTSRSGFDKRNGGCQEPV